MTQTILVADDHPLFRQALTLAIERVAPAAKIVEAGTVARAAELAARAEDLALVLLDLKMPGAEGFSGVALLHAERPGVPILVVSSADGLAVAHEACRFGAVGFIGKDRPLEEIETAIADALAGKAIAGPADPEIDAVAEKVAGLTPMQLKVLLGVLHGRLNKQIAYDLSISEATVKAHMTAVLRKLDVQNRTQAVLAARALGLGITH
ncbi:response regulator [Sphingomonas sp. 37zxx]|uniref:response regulator n=1 Tax=Sphingomonas sp. 37zxx TaxID=1550073 RepID=UPI00053C011E|nr:response regulator transcription factor [Sphingomonas sp. 37zxx]